MSGFKKTEMRRVIQTAQGAGLNVVGLEVDPDGKITVRTSRADGGKTSSEPEKVSA